MSPWHMEFFNYYIHLSNIYWNKIHFNVYLSHPQRLGCLFGTFHCKKAWKIKNPEKCVPVTCEVFQLLYTFEQYILEQNPFSCISITSSKVRMSFWDIALWKSMTNKKSRKMCPRDMWSFSIIIYIWAIYRGTKSILMYIYQILIG